MTYNTKRVRTCHLRSSLCTNRLAVPVAHSAPNDLKGKGQQYRSQATLRLKRSKAKFYNEKSRVKTAFFMAVLS